MKPLNPNEIYLVYQDCAMCGARKGWGDEQTKVADKHGFKIIEVPFTSEGASEVITKVCLTHEIKPKKPGSMATLPFFTDLKHFSKILEDFIEKPEEDDEIGFKPSKKTKKRGKKSAEEKD